jgi:putative flippase GtrA
VTTDACAREVEPAARKEALAKSEGGSQGITLARWLKFNFVGAIGIVVQLAGLLLLRSVFRLNYLSATALAVEAAVVHNFLWHENFTWVDRIETPQILNHRTAAGRAAMDRIMRGCVPASWTQSLLRFARFNLSTGAVSILGNLGLMKMLAGQGRMNYLLANAIAIAICSLANFLLADEWVFDAEMRVNNRPCKAHCDHQPADRFPGGDRAGDAIRS